MLQLIAIINTTTESIDADTRPGGSALERARQALADGAHWVDIGGQATNPWASQGDVETEWKSIADVLPTLLNEFPGRVSLDTFRPEVAEQALASGKVIINDVTMFHDPRMIELAVAHSVMCIVSHLPLAANGSTAWAHENATMDDETDVLRELLERRRQMIQAGVRPEHIILDPGIGFGKTSELNRKLLEFGRLVTDRQLLHQLDPQAVREPAIKVLIGHSQKRMIAEAFGGDKTDRTANLRAGKIAAKAGASYLRVHTPSLYQKLIDQ